MNENNISKLSEMFMKLPGIGPRQAKRFVYAIIDEDQEIVKKLVEAIKSVKINTRRCIQCYKAFEDKEMLCSLCQDSKRDQSKIMILEKDVDLENFEKLGTYDGLYHLLNGTISPLDKNSAKKLHLKELFERVKKNISKNKIEIILATSTTASGEMTAIYIERILEPFKNKNLIISRLARGLSAETELEFTDPITLKNALLGRKLI